MNGKPEVTQVVQRNIRAILEVQRQFERKRRLRDRIADAITRFTGSMTFVWIHAVIFGAWLVLNAPFVHLPHWDPYPYVMLAMAASVEAIFLSTFVLITQNRMAELNDKRANLDLQINLLSEHEITRLIKLVDALARKSGIELREDEQLAELERDVRPEQVLAEIEHADSEGPQ
jgi:uncharacterized membrane protein